MKSDLDTLMHARNLDAILVIGNAAHNPPMVYLTGGAHVSGAALIKRRGALPIIFCGDMEREEAAKSGYQVISFNKYPWRELLQQSGGDNIHAYALRFQRMLADAGIERGRVGVYGTADLGNYFGILSRLQSLSPSLELVGEEMSNSLFLYAQETKDETEVTRIRRMGRITTEVVGLVAQYLAAREVRKDETLLNENGKPLTVGEVKKKINLWLAERGAENPKGTIFAIGRDAGVPHSAGEPTDLIRLGRTIVFDIYPCEEGGGYYYDFTRTWSLGYATPEAQKLYDQVREAYEKSMENLDLNAPFKEYQRMVCELFEKHGHQTPLTVTAPIEGYVHSLGHGLGLNLHERPASGFTATDDNRLRPGVVITIEPGLYYPDRGMGVRLEDTVWVRPDGRMEILAPYPLDFVLPMKRARKSAKKAVLKSFVGKKQVKVKPIKKAVKARPVKKTFKTKPAKKTTKPIKKPASRKRR
jgi:Xaa-Pro aminopeptidase